MANHELYVVQGKTLDNIAGTMRAVLGVEKDAPIRFDEVANSDKTEQINADVETQADIIAQIKTALEGKAAGNGGTEEIENIIDNSDVLEGTYETVEDKVEALIDKAKVEAIWYEMTVRTKTINGMFYESDKIRKLPKSDFSLLQDANSAFEHSTLEEIDFYIDSANLAKCTRMFANTPNLRRIVGVNMSKVYAAQGMFQYSAIEIIERPLDGSLITTSSQKLNFDTNYNLREVRFVDNSLLFSLRFICEDMSANSIISAFGGLSSDVTGQTLTIPLKAVKKAFETSEDANDGDTSEAWITLKNSKSNWTITLS